MCSGHAADGRQRHAQRLRSPRPKAPSTHTHAYLVERGFLLAGFLAGRGSPEHLSHAHATLSERDYNGQLRRPGLPADPVFEV